MHGKVVGKSSKFELDLSKAQTDSDLPSTTSVALEPSTILPESRGDPAQRDLLAEQSVTAIEVGSQMQKQSPKLPSRSAGMVGRRLAAAVEEGGYQPVILFGNAASGKTSLLLSLFASIRTTPDLKTSIALAPDVIQDDSDYARYNLENAERFLNLMTQQFIQGQAPAATAIEDPFLIPVTFEPVGKPACRFVFIESNGEWYRPDYTDNRLFPKFRAEIEDFVRNCQRGIIFLHLLPQTQLAVRGGSYNQNEDTALMDDASVAVAGALANYRNMRVEREQDFHLMLVTKWDNRSKSMNIYDALSDHFEDVEEFVLSKYGQAYAEYQGLTGIVKERQLNGYCAGLMSEDGVLSLRPDNDLRPYVLKFPKNLWRWLYRSAQANQGYQPVDPFPSERHGNFLVRLIEKIVG